MLPYGGTKPLQHLQARLGGVLVPAGGRKATSIVCRGFWGL